MPDLERELPDGRLLRIPQEFTSPVSANYFTIDVIEGGAAIEIFFSQDDVDPTTLGQGLRSRISNVVASVYLPRDVYDFMVSELVKWGKDLPPAPE